MQPRPNFNHKLIPQNLHTLNFETISPSKGTIEEEQKKNPIPFKKTFSNSTFMNYHSQVPTLEPQTVEFSKINQVANKQKIEQFAQAVFQCAICKTILFNNYQLNSLIEVSSWKSKNNQNMEYYYLFDQHSITNQLLTTGAIKYNNEQFDSYCAYQEFKCASCQKGSICRLYESAPHESEFLIDKLSLRCQDTIMYQVGVGVIQEQDKYLKQFFGQTQPILKHSISKRYSDSLEIHSTKHLKTEKIDSQNLQKQIQKERSEREYLRTEKDLTEKTQSSMSKDKSKEIKYKLLKAMEDVKLIDHRLTNNERANRKFIYEYAKK